MNFIGRWKLKNGLIAAVHVNPTATKGDREIRYKGHTVEYDKVGRGIIFELVLVWNENGECVTVQGVADNCSNYDLAESINNVDKYSRERSVKVVGCKECEG